MNQNNVGNKIDLNVQYVGDWGGGDPDWLQPVSAYYDTETQLYNVTMISPLPSAVHVSYSYNLKGRDSGTTYVSVSDIAMNGLSSVTFDFKDVNSSDASFDVSFGCSDIDNPDATGSSAVGMAIITAYIAS